MSAAQFSMTQETGGDSRAKRIIAVSGKMTAEHGMEIAVALLAAFREGADVRLDLGAVTETDLSGLQLICSAHRTALARNRRFSLSHPLPVAVANEARNAGFFPRFAGCQWDAELACLWSGIGK